MKRFSQRETLREELFEDLNPGEHFLPSFLQIDRILDVNDDQVDMANVDFSTVPLPTVPETSTSEDDGNPAVNEVDSQSHPQPTNRRTSLRKRNPIAKSSNSETQSYFPYLYSSDCWMTIKWEGLAYSECSIESVQDLINAKIEFELIV